MKYRILTVCTGNICRSPMAEIVLANALARVGIDAEVDSAAVTREETGNPIDSRAQKVLRAAGYGVPPHAAKRLEAEDMRDYDLVLPMTAQHKVAIDRIIRSAGMDPRDPALAEVKLFRTFASDADQRSGYDLDVPDPWYGGPQDFVETLEIIEDALPALVEHVRCESV